MSRPVRWTDAELLEALHLRDVEGLSYGQVARRLGVTRNMALGACSRVDIAADAIEAQSPEPGRHDGTMPAGWWRDGLARRPEGAA